MRNLEFRVWKLRRARQMKGLSLRQLAALLNLHYSTVYRIEDGQFSKPATIKRMADYLGLRMEDIVIGGPND